MNKIQTWLSDLSDWFYNLKNLNTIAFTVSLADEIQDDMLDDEIVFREQIKELYQRVKFLETVESGRRANELLQAAMKSSQNQTKKTSKPKRSAKKKK